MIFKGKLRFHQLTGMDPAKIVILLTNEESEQLWVQSESWYRACSNFGGDINNKYPQSKMIEFLKKTNCILPRIVRDEPISGAPTFYTNANKPGKEG